MCNNSEPTVAGDNLMVASIQAAIGFSVKSLAEGFLCDLGTTPAVGADRVE